MQFFRSWASRSLRADYGGMSGISQADWQAAEPDPLAPSVSGLAAHLNADHADAGALLQGLLQRRHAPPRFDLQPFNVSARVRREDGRTAGAIDVRHNMIIGGQLPHDVLVATDASMRFDGGNRDTSACANTSVSGTTVPRA